MTRDSPGQLSSSELRDVSLAPSCVRAANISIIHPQLRDLVLPVGRGHVLYPHGSTIEEHKWRPDSPGSNTTMLYKLIFTPSCLTTNGAILAAGGQKGELFLADYHIGKLATLPPVKPFVLNLTVQSRQINNSITILPAWPRGWLCRQAEVKRRWSKYAGPRGHDGMEVDEGNESGSEAGEEDAEDWDLLEELDEDEEDCPLATSPATYPNTLPFGSAPRIQRPGQRRRQSGPQVVTSQVPGRASPANSSTSTHRNRRSDEPRILVSNNDQTVKMFSLRRTSSEDDVVSAERGASDSMSSWMSMAARANPHADNWANVTPNVSALRYTAEHTDSHYQHMMGILRNGTSSTSALHPHNLFGEITQQPASHTPVQPSATLRRTSLASSRNTNTAGVPRLPPQDVSLRANRYLGESVSAYRDRNPEGEAADQARVNRFLEERQARASRLQRGHDDESCRLTAVGGTKFRAAVNHSSLSPDLRTMVTVGDSKTDVYLYEVIDGGREFRKIGTYNAATDSSFSTSWSKDGRKFAVASQDGQVTVWDHRSSHPLAVFYTSASTALHDYDDIPRLMDPPVSSQSGREPARVVKFSPEGSARDLLVFSEEHTHIHIVDARTFNTHVVVPVPFELPGSPEVDKRRGFESGQWGVAGVAFDPSGDWLYAGTERTVVEWDLRRYGGGEGGTWSMA